MNEISKPHLVLLLRAFDRLKYFVPRIRYASVRSKPDLVNDLSHYYRTRTTKDTIHFLARHHVPSGVPKIRYCLIDRQYYFDDKPLNPLKQAKCPVEIRRGSFVVEFQGF